MWHITVLPHLIYLKTAWFGKGRHCMAMGYRREATSHGVRNHAITACKRPEWRAACGGSSLPDIARGARHIAVEGGVYRPKGETIVTACKRTSWAQLAVRQPPLPKRPKGGDNSPEGRDCSKCMMFVGYFHKEMPQMMFFFIWNYHINMYSILFFSFHPIKRLVITTQQESLSRKIAFSLFWHSQRPCRWYLCFVNYWNCDLHWFIRKHTSEHAPRASLFVLSYGCRRPQ